MQLIFCNILPKTQIDDLIDFAETNLKSGLGMFRDTGIIECVILEITDLDTLSESYFGLMTFDTPNRGERAIRVLNGKKMLGRPVKVREYKHRAPGDRRITKDTQGLNRPEERRRKNLQFRYKKARS
jgi:RNA recognition motif-containing protein